MVGVGDEREIAENCEHTQGAHGSHTERGEHETRRNVAYDINDQHVGLPGPHSLDVQSNALQSASVADVTRSRGLDRRRRTKKGLCVENQSPSRV
jgi:hypothetical protein